MTGAANSGADGGSCSSSVNGGVHTLTTPTLTPTTLTTLRNIEQMFAESDPHAPPYHHENAAGFVPPIISPTSGAFSPVGLKPSDVINTPDTPLPLLSPSRANAQPEGPLSLLSPSRANSYPEGPIPLLSPSKAVPPFLANSVRIKLENGVLEKSSEEEDAKRKLDALENAKLPSDSGSKSAAALSRPQTLSIPRPVTLDLSCPRNKLSRPQTLPLASGSSKPKFVLPGEPPGALTSPRQDLPPSPQTPLSILAGLSSPILSGLASPNIGSLTTAVSVKSPTSPSLSQLLSVAAAAAARSQYTSPRGSSAVSNGLLGPPLPSFGEQPIVSSTVIETKVESEEKAEDLSISRPETPLTSPTIKGQAGKHAVKTEGGLPAKNIEFLDKFLKAAAAASPMLNTPTSAMLLSPVKDLDVGLLRAISPPQHSPTIVGLNGNGYLSAVGASEQPAVSSHLSIAQALPTLQIPAVTVSPAVSQSALASPASLKRRNDSATSDDRFGDEDYKKLQRRERNKLAAARCRKRRLDLTNQLQDEVSEWEQKVRSLKQELLELEQLKKGLESVLRHKGPCKRKKKSISD